MTIHHFKIQCLAVAGILSFDVAATAKEVSGPADIDPEAVSALDRMSATLREMDMIAFDANVSQEQVLTNGQKLQFESRLIVRAARPDRLFMETQSDRQNRQYFFDGKVFTVVAPKLNYYTNASLEGSIVSLVSKARDHFAIDLPLADLFAWDSNADLRARVKSGYVVRPETISGKSCTHYAFRQQKVDWQIWIADGEAALPCKLVITDTLDPARPQYTAQFNWIDGATISPSTFSFRPSSEMKRISIASAKEVGELGGGQ